MLHSLMMRRKQHWRAKDDDRSRESKAQTDRRIPKTNNKQPQQNKIQWPKVARRTNYSQYDDVSIAADSLALLQTWKNIPDMVPSVNTSIKQQILLTATKRNTNYINKSKTSNVECATKNKKKSLTLCVLVRLLRRVYTHHGMTKCKVTILPLSPLSVWLWERSLQTMVRTTTRAIENDKAKTMWNTAFSENLQKTAQIRLTWPSMTYRREYGCFLKAKCAA